jgi:hypothetical protein
METKSTTNDLEIKIETKEKVNLGSRVRIFFYISWYQKVKRSKSV